MTLSWVRPRRTTGFWPSPARRRKKAIRKSQATEGCTLFRAVAAAEGVHAERHLRLLGEAVVQSTEANLQSSFERESTVNWVTYPEFIREAEEEGESLTAVTFGQARDVEARHAALYKQALRAMLHEETHDYYVCPVCGFIAEREAPDECPICGAKREKFIQIAA
jgi:rubrerythrin